MRGGNAGLRAGIAFWCVAVMGAGAVWGAVPLPPSGPVPQQAPRATIDTTRVTVLGYHRFDPVRVRDGLSIGATEFERQMQVLKDRGLSVISMGDFLAWLRAEKTIPERAVLITVDDGYTSVHEVAWPILKKFGYPFTLFVYVNYISAGGKSLTWERIKEMADGGVEIGSHSLSHANLGRRGGRSEADYMAFLRAELVESRRVLEGRLGVKVRTFAYPYGIFGPEAVRIGREEARYDALFTVYGQKIARQVAPGEIGRYVVLSDKPEVFESAIAFGGGSTSGIAGVELKVQPRHGEVIGEDRPLIVVEVGALGEVDPRSLEMTVTGLGAVPATFDPAARTLSYQVRRPLRLARCTVGLKAVVGGKTVRTGWEFGIDERQRFARFLPEQYPAGE